MKFILPVISRVTASPFFSPLNIFFGKQEKIHIVEIEDFMVSVIEDFLINQTEDLVDL